MHKQFSNLVVQNLINCSTNKLISGKRAFVPITFSDDYEGTATDYMPAIKAGLVPMQGGETPGGLFITVLQDAQEKLLAYFMSGGNAIDLSENLLHMVLNDDVVVILGADLDFTLQVAFGVNKYDRSIEDLYVFPHFISVWSTEEVIRKVFSAVKLVDTLGG